MTCTVCVNDYTKVLRKQIKCPFCDYDACSMCIQQYLLSTPETPHCMACRKSLSRYFIASNFTMKFLNTAYKEHRENILFEKERSLMPMTQPDVERELRIRAYNREKMQHISHMSVLGGELSHMYPITEEDKDKELGLKLEIRKLELTIEKLDFLMGLKQDTSTKREFVRACAKNDCKGFLTTQWKCGICESTTCKDCGEVAEENHECNPDSVKTQQLLAKDSKPCPKCASVIFKITGCDQMYCTMCHTPFSWRTGRVETGAIHNPHYYEYQRLHGTLDRPIGDVQCGGLPNVYAIYRYSEYVSHVHRFITEFQAISMRKYTNLPLNNPQLNQTSRISYMLNEMSEKKFKSHLQVTDKDLNKRFEIGQIMTTYIQVVSDHMHIFVNDKNICEFIQKFTSTRDYFNSMLDQVSKAYQCTVPFIQENGKIISLRHP